MFRTIRNGLSIDITFQNDCIVLALNDRCPVVNSLGDITKHLEHAGNAMSVTSQGYNLLVR